jgi:Lon protease-like protein
MKTSAFVPCHTQQQRRQPQTTTMVRIPVKDGCDGKRNLSSVVSPQPLVFLLLLLLSSLTSKFPVCSAWVPSSLSGPRRHFSLSSVIQTRGSARKGEDDNDGQTSNNTNSNTDNLNDEKEEDFKRRMAIVRSLQMTYYKPAAATATAISTASTTTAVPLPTSSSLDERTGEVLDLPLFRAPWWEVPGRSNVLNIHEPIYTNMFEKILYGPKPWCFGHLYLKDGSRNLKSDDPKYQLESWETTTTQHCSESAVVGCLMNISDYRRFADGRLLLLVHAMERFVVTHVQQRLPYGICRAQILPDAEEIDPALDFGVSWTEADLALPRALAVQESVRYHAYEYDRDHVLAVPDKPDMKLTDIVGSDIAKVLPYCPFSKTLLPPEPCYNLEIPPPTAPQIADTTISTTQDDEPIPSLEYRLLCRGVYQTPLVDPDFPQRQHLTTDELEYELWLAMNNFLIQTRTPVSPILLGLLPVHLDIWPSSFTPSSTTATSALSEGDSNTHNHHHHNGTECDLLPPSNKKPFALKQIVAELASMNSFDHDFVQVSPDYPVHRRQRRLSYSAAHLLEANSDVANELRPKLLAIPTTRQRLRMVLEKFDQWQERKWGEFQ